jgi:hypothetical protein
LVINQDAGYSAEYQGDEEGVKHAYFEELFFPRFRLSEFWLLEFFAELLDCGILLFDYGLILLDCGILLFDCGFMIGALFYNYLVIF